MGKGRCKKPGFLMVLMAMLEMGYFPIPTTAADFKTPFKTRSQVSRVSRSQVPPGNGIIEAEPQLPARREEAEPQLPARREGDRSELNKQLAPSQTCNAHPEANATLPELEAALSRQQAEDNLFGVGWCWLAIGVAKLKLNDVAGADNAFAASLKIWRETGNQVLEGSVLYIIGRLYEVQDNNSRAIASYQESANTLENIIREDVKVEEYKVELASIQERSYQELVRLKWKAGRFEEAFNYVERSRARAFLDQLAYGKIDFRSGANANLLAREQQVRDELAQLRNKKAELEKNSGSPTAINEIVEKLKELEKEYADVWKEVQERSPEIASLQRVDVASLKEIQGLLDTDTTLVEYYVTEENGTLAFIITRNSFKSVALKVSKSDLTQKIEAFRKSFRRAKRLDDPSVVIEEYLQPLYQKLIADLKPYITTRTIGIVPHGILHYLPFAALTVNDRYLSDDYSLFTLPSASVLRFLPQKRKPKTGKIFAVGNPLINEPDLVNLPAAEGEASALAKMYGTKPLLGKDATESSVQSNAGGAEILHLAAHGKYDPDNPQSSTIYLAPDAQNDGRLEIREIYKLNLTAATNLVVLSACEGQVGKLNDGDEVVALNRAFLYAGTPSVVASLWLVSDTATSLLMERFYQHLQAGRGKAEALRQAQIELRRDYREYRHPYYWAAFTLTGDWRN